MFDKKKFILLIKNREALYNRKLKDHRNQNVLKTLWEEVAAEMGSTVLICQLKWTSLRNSYARFVRREFKRSSLGTNNRNRKEWGLANALSFLTEHMNYYRKMSLTYDVERNSDLFDCFFDKTSSDNFESVNFVVGKNDEISEAKSVAEPVEYLETLPLKKRGQQQHEEEEDYHLLFFQALLPDINKLTEKNQRKIRQNFLFNLNKFLDEQK